VVFLQQERIFLTASKKNVLKERKKEKKTRGKKKHLGEGKKCFVTLSGGIFLASEKIYVRVLGSEILAMNLGTS